MQQYCPSCRRAWVQGETTCPFCGFRMMGMPYGPGAGSPRYSFVLRWTGSDGVSHSSALPTHGLRVGRGPENEISLADPQVSRQHAAFWVAQDRVYVRDLGSTNGTWVNGELVRGERALGPGDQVTLGGTTFRVEVVPGSPVGQRPVVSSGPAGAPVPGGSRGAGSGRRPGAALTHSSGRGFTLTGALALLICFFLPWVSCTVPFTGERVSLSGARIATATGPGSQIDLSELGIDEAMLTGVPPGFLLLAIPLVALGAIGVALAGAKASPESLVARGVGQIALSLVAFGVLIWFYSELGIARELLHLDFGYWGSWLSAGLVLLGGVLDLISANARGPG